MIQLKNEEDTRITSCDKYFGVCWYLYVLAYAYNILVCKLDNLQRQPLRIVSDFNTYDFTRKKYCNNSPSVRGAVMFVGF